MGICKFSKRHLSSRNRLTYALLWIAVITVGVCEPSPLHAKPQISASCDPTFSSASGSINLYLWYNVYNSNELTWDNYISIDEFYEGSEVGTYPKNIDDIKTDKLSQATATAHAEAYAFTAVDASATVYFYVSGEWNGATAWSTYSPAIMCPPPNYFYQYDDRCVPTCSYGAPMLMTAPTPASQKWSVQVLGRQAPVVNGGHTFVPVNLEIANKGADTPRNIYLRYTIVTKTAVDADPIQVVPDGNNNNVRKIETASATAPQQGDAKYYLVPAANNANPQQPLPGITPINDFSVQLPDNPAFVYIDIFAIDVMSGEQYSVALPRVQLYP